MRWLLFICLLFPTVPQAQIDTLQSAEISGLNAENLDMNNPTKIILSSFSINQISGSLSMQDSKQDTIQLRNRKSPTKAFILSFVGGATFLPGLGQHYNGEHKKGLLMGAIWYSGWFIAAGTEDRNSEKTGQAIGIPLVVTTWVWSCIDALSSAKKINRKHREQNTYGHMLELHEKQLTLGLDLNIYKRTIMPNLTLHF